VAEEEALRVLTRDLADAGYRLFRGVRLPSLDGTRRYELDFVIVSPNDAIVVELKNWAGEVRARGRSMEQVRRGGEVVDHGDVLGELERKVAALGGRHRKTHRKTPPMRALLVFHNRSAVVDPKLLARDDVVSFAELRAEVSAQAATDRGEAEGVLVGLLRWLGLSDTLAAGAPDAAIDALCASLSALGTWDTVELHGGQRLSGDVLGGAEDDVIVNDLRLTDRERFDHIEVEAERSVFWALFSAPTCHLVFVDRAGKKLVGKAPSTTELRFHEVGQRSPSRLPLGQLRRISFGSRLAPRAYLAWADLVVGAKLSGTVTGTAEFGVFVDFGGPKDGLIHSSNLEGRAVGGFARGDRVEVEVVELDARRQRIGLRCRGATKGGRDG